uniref:Zinc finger, C3HC4 type (RING finger) domain-containing protein n=1 Tax=Macrostomum lignano TaxID=282301 RepID=A0A1I8JMT8_9PLAT
ARRLSQQLPAGAPGAFRRRDFRFADSAIRSFEIRSAYISSSEKAPVRSACQSRLRPAIARTAARSANTPTKAVPPATGLASIAADDAELPTAPGQPVGAVGLEEAPGDVAPTTETVLPKSIGLAGCKLRTSPGTVQPGIRVVAAATPGDCDGAAVRAGASESRLLNVSGRPQLSVTVTETGRVSILTCCGHRVTGITPGKPLPGVGHPPAGAAQPSCSIRPAAGRSLLNIRSCGRRAATRPAGTGRFQPRRRQLRIRRFWVVVSKATARLASAAIEACRAAGHPSELAADAGGGRPKQQSGAEADLLEAESQSQQFGCRAFLKSRPSSSSSSIHCCIFTSLISPSSASSISASLSSLSDSRLSRAFASAAYLSSRSLLTILKPSGLISSLAQPGTTGAARLHRASAKTSRQNGPSRSGAGREQQELLVQQGDQLQAVVDQRHSEGQQESDQDGVRVNETEDLQGPASRSFDRPSRSNLPCRLAACRGSTMSGSSARSSVLMQKETVPWPEPTIAHLERTRTPTWRIATWRTGPWRTANWRTGHLENRSTHLENRPLENRPLRTGHLENRHLEKRPPGEPATWRTAHGEPPPGEPAITLLTFQLIPRRPHQSMSPSAPQFASKSSNEPQPEISTAKANSPHRDSRRLFNPRQDRTGHRLEAAKTADLEPCSTALLFCPLQEVERKSSPSAMSSAIRLQPSVGGGDAHEAKAAAVHRLPAERASAKASGQAESCARVSADEPQRPPGLLTRGRTSAPSANEMRSALGGLSVGPARRRTSGRLIAEDSGLTTTAPREVARASAPTSYVAAEVPDGSLLQRRWTTTADERILAREELPRSSPRPWGIGDRPPADEDVRADAARDGSRWRRRTFLERPGRTSTFSEDESPSPYSRAWLLWLTCAAPRGLG